MCLTILCVQGGGRGGRGRGGGGDNKRQREDGGNQWIEKGDFTNESFEEYYKTQNICPDSEWEDFMGCLRKPLPVTFRINGGGRFADHLRDKMNSDFFVKFKEGDEVNQGGVQYFAAHALAWRQLVQAKWEGASRACMPVLSHYKGFIHVG